jgi:hypothetical protein
MSIKDAHQLSEAIVMKFRKWYSITDLQKFGILTHINPSNFYAKKSVCGYCKGMYDKIDYNRIMHKNSANVFLKMKHLIPIEISKLKSETIYQLDSRASNDKKIFSDKFYQKLKDYCVKQQNEKCELKIPNDCLDSYDQRRIKSKEKFRMKRHMP